MSVTRKDVQRNDLYSTDSKGRDGLILALPADSGIELFAESIGLVREANALHADSHH